MWRNTESTLSELNCFLSGVKDLVVFDTETTGFKDSDSIIQISGIKLKRDFTEISRFDSYSNPAPNIISAKITEITGITNAMVEDAEPEETVLMKFMDWSCPEEVGYLAYNAPFDKRMTESSLKKYGITIDMKCFDVLKLAKDVLVNDSLNDFKLGTVAEHLGVVPENANFHSSMFDVEMTVLVFKKLLTLLKDSPPTSTRNKIKPVVYSLNPWCKGKTQRIYIPTSMGTVYYDKIKACFGSKDADMDQIDMAFVEKQAEDLAKKGGYENLSKVKEQVKKYA